MSSFLPVVFNILCFPCVVNETKAMRCAVFWQKDWKNKSSSWTGDFASCTMPGEDIQAIFQPCPTLPSSAVPSGLRSLCNRTDVSMTTLTSQCTTIPRGINHDSKCTISEKAAWPFWQPPAHFPNKGVLMLWISFGSVCCVLTVILNITTSLVFLKSRRLRRSKTIVYAANMAFIDILIGLSILPIYVVITYNYNIQRFDEEPLLSTDISRTMENWHAWLDLILLVASFVNLAFMSLERCIVVLKPFWHHTHATFGKLVATVPLVWIYALIIFFLQKYTLNTAMKKLILAFITGFALPTILIAVSYILIVWTIKNANNRVSTSDKNMSAKKRRTENRVSLNLLVLKVAFLLCWLPNFIALFVYTDEPSEGAANALRWAKLFSYFHCFLDPILYAFAKANIREEVGAVIKGTSRISSIAPMMRFSGEMTPRRSDNSIGHPSRQ